MGYNNKPTMPNNGYQKGGFNKNYNQKKNNINTNYNQKQQDYKQKSFNSENKSLKNTFNKNDNFFFKDDEDIYSPKIYAKKPKPKSSFDDIVIPEYMMEKQKARNKRENDKKYKNKDRGRY